MCCRHLLTYLGQKPSHMHLGTQLLTKLLRLGHSDVIVDSFYERIFQEHSTQLVQLIIESLGPLDSHILYNLFAYFTKPENRKSNSVAMETIHSILPKGYSGYLSSTFILKKVESEELLDLFVHYLNYEQKKIQRNGIFKLKLKLKIR